MVRTRMQEDEKFDLSRCAGCGKEWRPNAHGYDKTEAYVGPEKVYVCSGGRSDYRGAKKSCILAARDKASRCPGCGAGGTPLGEICRECRKKIELAEGNPDVRDRQLYGFRTEKILGRVSVGYWAETDDVRRLGEKLETEARELVRLLAQGCTTGEYRPNQCNTRAVVPFASEEDKRRDSGKAGWEDPQAELLPRQAEALDEFARRLRPYFDHVYEYGKQTGHSFLVRLATGDMTREQFEELDEKVEKQKRGEAAEDES